MDIGSSMDVEPHDELIPNANLRQEAYCGPLPIGITTENFGDKRVQTMRGWDVDSAQFTFCVENLPDVCFPTIVTASRSYQLKDFDKRRLIFVGKHGTANVFVYRKSISHVSELCLRLERLGLFCNPGEKNHLFDAAIEIPCDILSECLANSGFRYMLYRWYGGKISLTLASRQWDPFIVHDCPVATFFDIGFTDTRFLDQDSVMAVRLTRPDELDECMKLSQYEMYTAILGNLDCSLGGSVTINYGCVNASYIGKVVIYPHLVHLLKTSEFQWLPVYYYRNLNERKRMLTKLFNQLADSKHMFNGFRFEARCHIFKLQDSVFWERDPDISYFIDMCGLRNVGIVLHSIPVFPFMENISRWMELLNTFNGRNNVAVPLIAKRILACVYTAFGYVNPKLYRLTYEQLDQDSIWRNEYLTFMANRGMYIKVLPPESHPASPIAQATVIINQGAEEVSNLTVADVCRTVKFFRHPKSTNKFCWRLAGKGTLSKSFHFVEIAAQQIIDAGIDVNTLVPI